jgi:hypothetical protein
MTRLSAWTVRAALLYLGAGFLIGAVMLFEKGVPLQLAALRLLPMHVEFVLIGWTLQLAMGVAFWILPRFSREPRYGNQRYGWIAVALLNMGVLGAGVGHGWSPPIWYCWQSGELLALFFLRGLPGHDQAGGM